ncbi:MAG: T9SS type A sorting domain-containing protein [Lewinellaceae bacterium]|nr:T9SS type A sorting domain-containing protein [Lewinellaceae bacterium]
MIYPWAKTFTRPLLRGAIALRAGLMWGSLLMAVAVVHGQEAGDAIPGKPGLSNVARFSLPVQDNDALLEKELTRRKSGENPHFAVPVSVDIAPATHGTWEELVPGGTWVWRQRITSDGAHSLNLGITDFYLPPGARLFFYNPSMETVHGPYTYADNESYAQLWTPVVDGDELIVEVQVSVEQRSNLHLRISTVNHDFYGVHSVLAGSCNLDVACGGKDGWGIVDPFRDQIQSVALYTVGGIGYCTGFLVNNAREDCTPYFMTAFHCDVNSSNAQTMVVYWNYQNSFCRQPNSGSSGNPGNGSRALTNTGAIFRAGYAPSDFTLVELDDPIPPAANAFFAGWNLGDQLPRDSAVCIHHPSTEEKRISFTYQPIHRGQWGQGSANIPTGNHLIVPSWDIGTTEDGSSGSPLFNARGQVIGQLHGGGAACGNSNFDAFGWIKSSWTGGGANFNRLVNWLDPTGRGLSEIGGRTALRCSKAVLLEGNFSRRICLPGETTLTFAVSDLYQNPVALVLEDLPAGLTARFSQNPALPGSTVTLTLTGDRTALPKTIFLQLQADDGLDPFTLPFSVELSIVPTAPALLLPADKAASQSAETTLRWRGVAGAQTYRWQLSPDSTFSKLLLQGVSTDTMARVGDLPYDTNLYWRVIAVNSCGETASAGFREFRTAPDYRIQVTTGNAPICQIEDFQFTLQVGAGFQEPLQVNYRIIPSPDAFTLLLPTGNDALKPGASGIIRGKPGIIPVIPGFYQIALTLTDGLHSATTFIALQLRNPPKAPVLLDPAPNTALVIEQPVLTWEPSLNANRYFLEIARDSLFTDRVIATEVITSSYRLPNPLPSGSYFWRVSGRNDCGGEPSQTQKFRLLLEDLGKINQLLIGIEPNPATEQINIHLSNTVSDLSLEVYAINGQLLWQQQGVGQQRDYTINVRNYPAGVYLVRVKYRQGSITRRIIVQH